MFGMFRILYHIPHDRPALKRLIRNIEQKITTTVVVYKLDRLGRRQLDVLHLLETVFEKNNVIFKSSTEPFETATPFGKAMIGMLAVFAQLERDMIIERTTSGRRVRTKSGLWPGGRIPFGYSWDKPTQQLIIIPEEATLIREIYNSYLDGHSRLAIAEWASQRSKARVFDHTIVRDILHRAIYMGKLITAGEIVDGQHEPIISKEVWYSVQSEFKKRQEGNPAIGEYLLTGLLSCGVCGANIVHVRRKSKKNSKEYIYQLYACKNQHIRQKDRNNNCSLGYSRREEVENFIIQRIKEIMLSPTKIQAIINNKLDNSPDTTVLKSLYSKLNTISAGLENLYDAIQSGDLKAAAVSKRIKKLEEEQEAIQLQIDEIEDKGKIVPIKNMHLLIREVGEAWDYLEIDEMKMMLRKIVKKIILKKKNVEPEIIWNL